MKIPSDIIKLVDRFGRNIDTYKRDEYKETRVRVEFIDPFFEALGWDVRNIGGQPEQYKDVVHEDTVSIAGKTRAPDYSFRVGGVRKFFLEAKKPSVDIKDNIVPAYQLRRYSWSVKLPIGVLTDFEELAIYDCRHSPKPTDNSSIGKLLYITFDQYLERYDEIFDLFSKQSVLNGSLDQYTQTLEGLRGAAEVDKELLKEIESWRDVLARNIALRNENLSVHELNFSVQRTIDRIIFLRMAEDRGIEIYGNLREIAGKTDIYPQLTKFYKQADDKYNAGLFDFNEDTLTPGLFIDDKVLKPILENLYYPNSPYEFSVLPVEILGQVYEQFLGKVIRLTPSHRAKIEEKPEVKKAGGVYYTPSYIVDYIVENTVGKILEGKTPRQINKLRIIDPSCGSGSFLLGAYKYLLDYHRRWYEEHEPDKHTRSKQPSIYHGQGGSWRLTGFEKKRILLNNIYGVDIDRQAVEVTKLSLLLQVLEGETDESLGQQLSLWQERALPNLGENIKCGNSLIGHDFFGSHLMPDVNEIHRVNPFDWETEFSEIFDTGGFDVVIGNPPWIFTKYVDWGEESKSYIQDKYLLNRQSIGKSRARQAGKINLFAIFTLKGLMLLKNSGLFGYIVPNNILRTTVYDIVRKQILESYKIKRIIDLKSGVFSGVTASTAILLIEKVLPKKNHKIEIIDNHTLGMIQDEISNKIFQIDCLDNPSYVLDIFTDPVTRSLIKNMGDLSIPLGTILRVLNGIATHKNKAGILETSQDENSKPILFGKDVSRYHYTFSGKYVEYIRDKLLRARDENIFLAQEKLIMQRIGGILVTAYDNQKYYTFNSINNLILKNGVRFNIKFILGLLNSKLFRFYYVTRFTNKSKLTVNISKTFLDQLPIYNIDFNTPEGISRQEKMVRLVEVQLSLHQNFSSATILADKKMYQRQIDATNEQIDRFVYDLYELTDDEIKVVLKYFNT